VCPACEEVYKYKKTLLMKFGLDVMFVGNGGMKSVHTSAKVNALYVIYVNSS